MRGYLDSALAIYEEVSMDLAVSLWESLSLALKVSLVGDLVLSKYHRKISTSQKALRIKTKRKAHITRTPPMRPHLCFRLLIGKPLSPIPP